MNWRILVTRFVVNAALIGLVVWLVPGLRTSYEVSLLDIGLISIAYGLLNQFVRPVLNLVLMPYLVQSYGLIVVIVDVVVFALLVLLTGGLGTTGLVSLIAGGVLLGLLRFVAMGLLGLTPPVIEDAPVRPPPVSSTRVGRLFPSAQEGLRLLRVRETIVDHGMDAAFNNAGVVGAARRRLQTWLWRPAEPIVPLAPPVRLRLMLQELGPTYVKVGQIISSQARTLPSDWEDELEKLQSDVRPYPYEAARARIIDELGAPPEELYEWFDPEPLAAASLAQVHRARTHDGVEVAVKVQRPGIHGKLRSDVRILARMSDALERRAKWAEGVDLAGVFLEFGSTLLRELDYGVEAYNARRLADGLADIDGVSVPGVVYELSSSGVLTLEFVPGVKSTDSDALDAAEVDREPVAINMVRAAVKMMMIDGFFHADPHPGNVFVDLDTGELTLLDTGMVGELTLDQRVRLVSLLVVLRNGDTMGLAQTMKSLASPFRETDDAAYYRQFERTLLPYLDPPPGQKVEVAAKVLPASMDLLRDNGYRLDREFTLAIKALTQAEAISSALVPSWTGTDFTAHAMDAAVELIPEALTPEAMRQTVTRQVGFAVREASQQLPTLQEGVFRWIDHLKRGAVRVELDTRSLNDQLTSLRGIAMMMTLGVLISGLVIGAAIAAGAGGFEGSALESVTDFAGVVFVLASVLGVLAIIVLLWRLSRSPDDERRQQIDRL